MMPTECPLIQKELEELDALLIGGASPALRAHSAQCVSCEKEVSAFSESIAAYNRASLAWAEARSNTFTRDLSSHQPARHVTAFAVRSIAATLILAAMATLTAGAHLWSSRAAEPALEANLPPNVRTFAPETRAQQIARDNAMLEAIDAELTEPEFAPPALLHPVSSQAARLDSAQDRD